MFCSSPGKLTADEFAIMETHTIVGAKTLDAALERFPNADFFRWPAKSPPRITKDSTASGYPRGLVGQQIPLCGRIVAVADVYDALTSRRVYKDAMTHEQARAIILRERGSHFDPEVVDAFLRAEKRNPGRSGSAARPHRRRRPQTVIPTSARRRGWQVRPPARCSSWKTIRWC